jgi:hypothetical protein
MMMQLYIRVGSLSLNGLATPIYTTYTHRQTTCYTYHDHRHSFEIVNENMNITRPRMFAY